MEQPTLEVLVRQLGRENSRLVVQWLEKLKTERLNAAASGSDVDTQAALAELYKAKLLSKLILDLMGAVNAGK